MTILKRTMTKKPCMRLNRKRLSFLLALAIALSVSGCTAKIEYPIENEHYTIYEEDGRCYLEINPVPEIYDEDGSIDGMFAYISFSLGIFPSVQEMRRVILSGDFEGYKGSLFIIQAEVDSNDGRVEIYDLRTLWDLWMPDDTDLTSIYWIFDCYMFECSIDRGGSVKVIIATETHYQSSKRYYFEERDNDLEILSETKLSDRNVTQTLYKNGDKELRYEITDGDRTIQVYEEYFPWGDNPEVPQIVVFGADGNEQEEAFYANASLNERPTVEWLTSFELIQVR